MSDERSPAGRALFYIEGGFLARTDGERLGRFEMRLTPDGDGVIAAVHDFRPTLPWYIYEYSQAVVHLAVMKLFGRHLARCGYGAARPPSTSGEDETPVPATD